MSKPPKESRPMILSVVAAGTPEHQRWLISDQFLRYFTGSGWTEQGVVSGAVLYTSSNDAIDQLHTILIAQYHSLPKRRFVAPVYLDLYSPQQVSVRDIQQWLVKTTKLLVDSPKHGNGPVAGSFGAIRIEFGEIKEMS
jgi:hypothetical protein